MPLPIYTAVGPSTGKYEGSVPLVPYVHSGKVHLLLQRGQEHSNAWTWTPGRRLLLAFPLSYLAWNFLSPNWLGVDSPLGPLLVHSRRALMMVYCCCRAGMSFPQKTLYVPIPTLNFGGTLSIPSLKYNAATRECPPHQKLLFNNKDCGCLPDKAR